MVASSLPPLIGGALDPAFPRQGRPLTAWSPAELTAISQKSCSVLNRMGPQIQWVQSYVTGDKIYCVYIAPDAEMVREHARQGGFPANSVSEVKTIIDPTTSES